MNIPDRIRRQFHHGPAWRWLVLAAAVYFLVRGPWRAIHDSTDFLTVFAAARCWIHGMNPYTPGELLISARAAGDHLRDNYFLAVPVSVYLPPALLLLSPLAALPWTFAKAIWLFCLLGATLWAALALARTANRWPLPVWTFLLAFAPLHTGIRNGQPSVLVCDLIAIGIVTPHPYLGGLLLGISACIKPQLALGFLLLPVALRQGRKLMAACATGLVLSGAALLWIRPGSLTTLLSNLSEIGSASGINSGSVLNPARFQLINVDTIVPQALYSLPVVALVYAIVALVSAIAVVKAVDTRMAVAVVASAALLLGYHRFYDAQILWLGIPAMLLMAPGRLLPVLWAGYGVFLIPGQTMAATWLNSRTNGPWSFLLLHHETLACVAVWLVFAAVAIQRGESRSGRALAGAAAAPDYVAPPAV